MAEPEVLRLQIVNGIDKVLGTSFVFKRMFGLQDDDIRLLRAIRSYAQEAEISVLNAIDKKLALEPKVPRMEEQAVTKTAKQDSGELMPLPVTPMPAINVFIAYMKKDPTITKVELGHAAIHLLAYGYSVIDPHTPIVKSLALRVEEILKKHPDDCCVDDCCKAIVDLTSTKAGVGDDPKQFDWMSLLTMAFQLLQLLLNRKA